jgi:hypothetical protein
MYGDTSIQLEDHKHRQKNYEMHFYSLTKDTIPRWSGTVQRKSTRLRQAALSREEEEWQSSGGRCSSGGDTVCTARDCRSAVTLGFTDALHNITVYIAGGLWATKY